MGPDKGEGRVVASDGREREIGASAVGVEIEDGEEPGDVGRGGIEEGGDLAVVGGGGDGEDMAEDAAAVLALAD